MDKYLHEIRPAIIGNLDRNKKPLPCEEKEQRNTIWTVLVFRRLCWFLLHDFDPEDVKIIPSRLKGSQIPVYIGSESCSQGSQ